MLLLLATCLQVTKVCKLCACVEGAEGTKKNCAKNLDAEPPLHDWYELEEVEEQAKITYPSPCGKCPDAKYYPKGSRPNMKKTAGNSKNCRNPDCTMYEKVAKQEESKKRKADAASPSQQTGRMQPVRLKGHAKKGMDIINERIKELTEELNGLVAVRDLANAGAAREPTDVDEDEDEDDDGAGAETGDGE